MAWASVGLAQPRTPDEVFDDAELLDDIAAAVSERVDVDDAAARAARFPGRSFADFDRDRDGAFYRAETAWGLYDVWLAIRQFLHDRVDADEDGIPGFYELECVYAQAGIPLEPTLAESRPGVPDGTVDCDADGLQNITELDHGLNPLDPTDVDADFDHDGTSNGDEIDAGTNLLPVLFLTPFDTGDADTVGVVVSLRQPLAAAQPALAELYVDFDPAQVGFASAALGAAAAAVQRNLFTIVVDADTVRFTLVAADPRRMPDGEIIRATFDREGVGDAPFTFDIETSRLSPAAARAAQTFGIGHPVEPLVLPGQGGD